MLSVVILRQQINENREQSGLALIQVVIAASIFSFLALAMNSLIVDQRYAVIALEDQLKKIQIVRNIETVLKDGISCQQTLNGINLSGPSRINFGSLKDNSGDIIYTSNSASGSLELGQMYLDNSTIGGPDSYGFIDVNIPIRRTRTRTGVPIDLETYKTKISVTTDSSNTISSCSIPDPNLLGSGTVHMTGVGNIICKTINFRGGYTESQVTLTGTLYYPPATVGTWSHWTISFSNVNYTAGTGSVCMDSGGWSGTVGAEWVKWIAYKQ